MTKAKNDVPQLFYFYKLCCNDPNVKEFYIGSTVNWIKRKHKHKSVCNNVKGKDYNSIKYRTIRANGGWENWSMIEIERGIYIRRMAEAHEYDLMANFKSTLNKLKCFNSSFKCEHDKQKHFCKTCKGNQICEHGKFKHSCIKCKGSLICEHDYINKNFCPYCSPYLCECGSWIVKGGMNSHFKTAKCKAFHMKEYGRVFI